MLIDWFTVFAQVVNFLVLIWLLKRFLYRPIINNIDAREKRIATEIADADAKSAKAEQQRNEFEQKNAEFEQQKTTRMNKLIEDTKAERAQLLETVRQEAEDLRKILQLALKNEQLNLQVALSQSAREEIFSITRKVLDDLAETSLEASMTEIFIRRLHELTDKETTDFTAAFNLSAKPILVQTAFTLPKPQCSVIKTEIEKILGHEITLQFAIEPKVISGIEISINGQKISWSINEYLRSLAKRVDELLLTTSSIENSDLSPSSAQDNNHETSA
ncbi:F0F1 ATP synthase subunit delta [Shewanella sp. ALD9]|uniref:F0F1 ATP synthase subunit delta n=1 Tax=Shewanella sp. ALD9 TaxID=2058330 RepID=UPI000C31BEEB|nr:F0F1 ATP synthase subunit delta [Shewanella sp. ALD9]PKH28006.1 F0F1 ATP synthase subunit B [Shewanella sp. ALD9]